MDIKTLHPELQKQFSRMPNPVVTNRFQLWFFRKVMNVMMAAANKADVDVTITEYKLSHGSIRVFTPSGSLSGAGLLWIHGGGLIMMKAESSDNDCRSYAKKHKAIVVSVDYRLAPEHPFPAANDDCFEAWQWFLENADRLGVDKDRIAIGGQSAGGGLAAGLCQRILDHGGVQPVAQYLIYPMLDDDTAAKTELDPIKHRMWTNANNRYGWTSYLGQAPGNPDVPDYAVPAKRDDLSGLPPAWVGVGDIDLFFEEDKIYADRLEKAGVYCEFYRVSQAPHGFEFVVPDASISKEFMQSANRFLKTQFSKST